MHSLYFVIFDKNHAQNSKEAREFADMVLENAEFCGKGYFSACKADWYRIGGGYSGELQSVRLGLASYESYKKLILKDSDRNKQQKNWENLGGKGIAPHLRDNHTIYKDDAMIVDEELYECLMKEYAEIEVFDEDNYYETTLDKIDKKDIIGRWIVLIDYHC